MSMSRLSKRLATLNQEQVAYINGCSTLQRAVWRITHEDPLFALRNQIKKFILREAILVLINIRNRNDRAILKLTINKWLKKVEALRSQNERLRALLKLIFINNDSKMKNLMSKYLHRWQNNASVSERDILKKYGYLFDFLQKLVKKSILPAKERFFSNLLNTTNPEYFRKPLRNIVKIYDRTLMDDLRRAFNTWRNNARDGALRDLKLKVLRLTVLSAIRGRDKQLLQKALRRWHHNALTDGLLNDFDDAELYNKVRSLYNLYGKYNKANRLNQLAKAFARWRLNTTKRGEPLQTRILKAKKHMLKHNINKNAEDLLNALRNIAEIKRIEVLLKKFINRIPRYHSPILRKALRKWYETTKTLDNRDLLRHLKLKHATDLADRAGKDYLREILRRALQRWRRNTSGPKTALPDTDKAMHLLRKATVQPFFNKMRKNIIKDMNMNRFRALIAAYIRGGDKDLLHWWLGEWRRNALRLKIYELKALLIKNIANTKERNEKLKAMKALKDKLNNYRLKDVVTTTILRNIISKNEKLTDEANKGKLVRALYIWRSKLDNKKQQEKLNLFDEGTQILRRFCWRTTHEDVLDAFDCKITWPAFDNLMRKIINNRHKNNVRDILLKKLYKWRMNCAHPEEDYLKKIREMFERYLEYEPIRKLRFEPYKDIVDAMTQHRDTKEDAARKIADYLRGIKDIPSQVRNLRISKYLMKIIHKIYENDYLRLKSTLKDWARRARNIKADEDARIIQKFIRDKLNKRLKRKGVLEEAMEHTRRYVLMVVMDKLIDRANKNRIPDILLKYYLRKYAEDMKLLREKFDHWKNLIPFMRLNDAAEKIQANYRGYLFRKDFDRYNRIDEILYKIISRMIERNEVEPAFHKWRKNARLIKCDEDSRIIQEFVRRNLDKKLKSRGMKELKSIFKRYVFKKITEMLTTKSINPDDVEDLVKLLRRIALQGPFDKLMKGLRWKIILEKLRNLPGIYDRNCKEILRKYLERWYTNAIEIPDELANKIQNAWRNYISRGRLRRIQKLREILEKLVYKYSVTDEDKILATLQKWRKNARLVKCEEDARIIQDFCRKVHEKAMFAVSKKWKNLAKKIMPRLINNAAKFYAFDRIVNQIYKRRALDNIIDTANKRNLYEVLEIIISRYDKDNLKNLLRKKFFQWLEKVRKLREIENDAATYIQAIYRGYRLRRDMDRDRKLQDILSKLVLRLIYNSDSKLPCALQKWRKNARLVKCEEDARIIQDFCRQTLDKINKMKNEEYLKKVREGLDKLNNLRLNIRYAWDKIRDSNKIDALKDLVGFLQDKVNQRNRETLDEIYQYGIDRLLNRLFPLREKYLRELLRKKLRQWRDKADKLSRLRAAEKIQKNWWIYLETKIKRRLYDLLNDILRRRNESDTDRLRRVLRQWRDNALNMGRDAAARRIVKYITERYLISKARKNWQDLSDKLRKKVNGDDMWELQKKLVEYLTLKDLMDNVNDKIKRDGLKQLKDGDYWLRILEILRKIFGEQDDRNNDKIKRRYLLRWIEKTRRLRDRENKLNDALNEIEKRQLINDVNVIANASLIKKFNDSIPVARAYDFFDKIRDMINRRNKLVSLKEHILRRIIEKIDRYTDDYLRKKLRQWNETARKIRDNAAKNRIAKWTEERYRISNARKNWKKLADLYDLYLQKRPLYDIRKRLIEYITLRDLTDKLRNRFTKTGKDQFKEGVNYLTILKFLRTLLENWDDRNRLLLLRYYLKKWNDKARKLKEREDALLDAFDTLNLKNLTDATNTVKNVSIVKQVENAIPVARAYDFFRRLREIYERNRKYVKLGEDLVHAKDDLDAFNKDKFLRRLYKVYYYKVLDNMFNRLNKLNDRYKKYFGDYFLNILQTILLSRRTDRYSTIGSGEKEPISKRLTFRAKQEKKIKVPQDRSAMTMLLPSLIKFLNDKFLNHKKWAWDKLVDNDRALKFCKLYKIFNNKTILQPKRDLVDLLKAEHAYMNGLGAANCDLFKLLRRYWIKLVCDSMLAPSRIYKILYLIKMVMMHKTIAYQRFIRELVRKWRFSAFIQSISRRKLELMYKNLHVSYLQMANELFGEKGTKNASVVKEFERISTRMGLFTNEDYNSVNEENFCEKITKKYVFQPMPLLLEKEGPTQFFASGIEIEDSGENNEDYYVDQELGGETIGKYKQETNKSNSKADKNSSRLSKY